MSREEIKEKLIALCAEIFQNSGVSTDMLDCMDFADDLGMDSITFITLIVGIEEIFDITIPDGLLLINNFRNIDDATKIITDLFAERI